MLFDIWETDPLPGATIARPEAVLMGVRLMNGCRIAWFQRDLLMKALYRLSMRSVGVDSTHGSAFCETDQVRAELVSVGRYAAFTKLIDMSEYRQHHGPYATNP